LALAPPLGKTRTERLDMKNASWLRGILILTILACIGAVAVTHFIVRPHIKTIVEERDAHGENWRRELARASDLTRNLNDTREKLANTEKALDETRMLFAAARERASHQEKRADTLQQNLDTARRELNETQQNLAAWRALPIPVERVAQVIESENKLRKQTAKLQQDLEFAGKENDRLTGLLHAFTRPEAAPPMPGVKGTIVAVDPKWNFVVLDVGEKAGAKPRGIFMVSRNGKLLGKVKVATVHADRSIANVLPGWQLEGILEGDQVIF
jgi:hypothetical protein